MPNEKEQQLFHVRLCLFYESTKLQTDISQVATGNYTHSSYFPRNEEGALSAYCRCISVSLLKSLTHDAATHSVSQIYRKCQDSRKATTCKPMYIAADVFVKVH